MESSEYTIILWCASFIVFVASIICQQYMVLHFWISGIRGKRTAGPRWKWPNGQLADKFVNGREMSNLWQEYGPIYRIWSGIVPEIVITRPEDVKSFYSDSSRHCKARSSNGGWVFHQLLGNCLGLINGGRWARLRKAFEVNNFEHGNANARVSDAFLCAREHVHKLSTLAEVNTLNASASINAFTATVDFPFLHIAAIMYGPMSEMESTELLALGKKRAALMRFVLRGGIYRSCLSWLVAPRMRHELRNFQKDWLAFNNRMIAKLDETAGGPVLASLRDYFHHNNSKSTIDDVLQTIDEIIFANLDVTTHVLSWMLILLAGAEDAQQDLRIEIEANKESLATYVSNKRSLLHRCFLETLRVRPVAAFTIPEYSPEDKRLDGYIIPAFTSVVVDTLSINIRNPFWGKDRKQFNPLRFETIRPSDLRYNLFTFGFGTRKCLGQYDAEVLIKAFIMEFVSKHEISLLGDEQCSGCLPAVFENWIRPADIELRLKSLEHGD